jgi:regulator of sigma D
MSEQENTTERRGNSSELINHMLIERQELLALLLQASNVKTDYASQSDWEVIDEFCQVLVDYIAAGHFVLYDRIVKKQERRKGVAELALQVYPRIDQATQIALEFNEKYNPENRINMSNLTQDLSLVGEELANRIELEDQLIGLLQEPREMVSD